MNDAELLEYISTHDYYIGDRTEAIDFGKRMIGARFGLEIVQRYVRFYPLRNCRSIQFWNGIKHTLEMKWAKDYLVQETKRKEWLNNPKSRPSKWKWRF